MNHEERDVIARRPVEQQVYTIARTLVATVWIWHGLVPKLIAKDADEFLPLTAGGIDPEMARRIVMVSGWGEIAFGLVVLLLWNQRWPLMLTIVVMIAALLGVLLTAPVLATRAFNPVTLNLLMIGSAIIGLITWRGRKG